MLDKSKLRKMSSRLESDPDDYINCLRRNIDMYISDKDITLSEVAELSGLSVSTLKNFLYGDAKDCHLSTVVKLARVFNVSIDELVGCGTISPQTCDSLQIMRQFPESFTYFVRWAIHFHRDRLTGDDTIQYAIEVMNTKCCANGNIKMSNQLDIIDGIEYIQKYGPKIFLGIKIPCEHYEPELFKNDILLIANDRKPMDGEIVVIEANKYMWILRAVYEKVDGKSVINLYSLRNSRLCANYDSARLVLGYVVDIKHSEDYL